MYAAKVLATKREAEIRLERQEGGGDERKETWKRKELALEGMDEEEIEKKIQKWKNRGKEGRRKRKRKTQPQSKEIN